MVLYAGPLQMLYERGFLRYISYRDTEILRMVYFALRDESWNTAEHVITHEEKDISWETFRIYYKSVSRLNGEDVIDWRCLIEGSPDSSVRFTIEGVVLKSLKKNRAGLCVLHPLDGVTGTSAQITQTDGEIVNENFPTTIAAENPFKNIKNLKWTFNNHMYELSFEGDVFETEDQRNWIDASFKTFCTPSALPIPVALERGDKIFQKVVFRPLHKLQPITSHELALIQLEKTGEVAELPRIGICCNQTTLTQKAVDEIKKVNFDHVRIEVTPSDNDWVKSFSEKCECAYQLALPIKVALFLSKNAQDEVQNFIQLSKQNRLNLNSVELLSTNSPVTTELVLGLVSEIRSQLLGVAIGAGTDSDYKEINRNRMESKSIDFVSFAAFPQVHAVDDQTMIENIEGIREAAKSGSFIYSGKAIEIAPLTMQSRGKKTRDKRQQSEFAALWTFGCLRAASEGHIAALSLFEVNGPNGILSDDDAPFPIHSTIESVLRYRNHKMIVLKNSEPLLVDAMLFTNDSSTTLFLVNYTDDLQTVRYGRNEFQVSPNAMQQINLSGA